MRVCECGASLTGSDVSVGAVDRFSGCLLANGTFFFFFFFFVPYLLCCMRPMGSTKERKKQKCFGQNRSFMRRYRADLETKSALWKVRDD